MPVMTLVPFTEDLLGGVQRWFHHPEVRRHLGGPQWPARELREAPSLVGPFRGRAVLRVHSWVALDARGVAVAKVGGEVYDRYTRFDGSVDPPVVYAVEPGPAMGLAYVVDPTRWRRGVGRAVLRAAVAHPDVTDVRVFSAGIDVDNQASRCCARSAGFTPDVEEPDWESTVYYLLRPDPVSAASGT